MLRPVEPPGPPVSYLGIVFLFHLFRRRIRAASAAQAASSIVFQRRVTGGAAAPYREFVLEFHCFDQWNPLGLRFPTFGIVFLFHLFRRRIRAASAAQAASSIVFQRRELRAARQRRTVNSFVGISLLRPVEPPGPPISYLWNCLPLPSLSPPNQSRISGSGGVFHCLPTTRITGGAAAPYREFVCWNFIASTSGTPWASDFLPLELSSSSISFAAESEPHQRLRRRLPLSSNAERDPRFNRRPRRVKRSGPRSCWASPASGSCYDSVAQFRSPLGEAWPHFPADLVRNQPIREVSLSDSLARMSARAGLLPTPPQEGI